MAEKKMLKLGEISLDNAGMGLLKPGKNGLYDTKEIHFAGAWGNPVPDDRCDCHACDRARAEGKQLNSEERGRRDRANQISGAMMDRFKEIGRQR